MHLVLHPLEVRGWLVINFRKS